MTAYGVTRHGNVEGKNILEFIGDPEAANTKALLSVVRSGYRPFQVVALEAPNTQPPAVPLLQE